MKPSRRIALAGVLSALIVVIMAVVSLIEVLDLSAAAICGLLMTVSLIELGTATSIGVYAVSGILSLLLVQNKGAALIFLLYAGFYPIVKQYLERIRPAVLSGVVKLVMFAVSFIIILFIGTHFGIFIDEIKWMLYPLALLAFAVYDITLYYFAPFYINKIRNKIKR